MEKLRANITTVDIYPMSSPIGGTPEPNISGLSINRDRGIQSASDLLTLPAELLHKVLANVGIAHAPDLASLASTCRHLHDFIYDNPDTALWRSILLARYDDPRLGASANIAWRDKVQNRAFVECNLHSYRISDHLERICDTLLDLYLDLPPRDPSTEDYGPQSFFAAPPTRNGPILDRALRSEAFNNMYLSNLTEMIWPDRQPGTESTQPEPTSPPHARPSVPSYRYNLRSRPQRITRNPTLARLHVLLPAELDADVYHHRQHRGYLRELVYGAKYYRAANDYAPLKEDGTVDWHLVNAVGTVMMLNAIDVLAKGEELWRPAIMPMSNGIEACRGLGVRGLRRPPDLAPDAVWDWAGVEGMWYGSYAYIDYTDWVHLNEPSRLVERLSGLREVDLADYTEAIGDLMDLHIVATHGPEAADEAYSFLTGDNNILPRIETSLPTSDLAPPVHFHGRSRQLVLSFVRGVVRLTSDTPPEVRWTIVIRYSGEDRWRLEGVQVGGRGSRRGLFGIWTDAAREAHSPNGPVWYWKHERGAQ